jgi:hypothetical protein
MIPTLTREHPAVLSDLLLGTLDQKQFILNRRGGQRHPADFQGLLPFLRTEVFGPDAWGNKEWFRLLSTGNTPASDQKADVDGPLIPEAY